tara:strand:- start:23479 stop:25095 length:1617 start_codon:yes stop_codon:yes gene_type:complete
VSIFVPQLDFTAAPTVFEALRSRARIRIIKGPFGSGKTIGMCAAVLMHALEQIPNPDGVRPFKATIVRNTKPELRSTTIDSWQSVYPEERVGSRVTFGSPMQQRIVSRPREFEWVRPPRFEKQDTEHGVVTVCADAGAYRGQPGLDLHVEFLGLDDRTDVKKLLSQQTSLFYFNELSEIVKVIFDAADLRHGRYPSIEQGGVPCTWSGMLADTNEPDDTHWLHDFEAATDNDPDVSVLTQPPALFDSTADEPGSFRHGDKYYRLNRQAENLVHLPAGYYTQRLSGKDPDWISRYLQVKRVFLQDGRPCVPGFDQQRMVDGFGLIDAPLLFGWDIGSGTLHPACVIAQQHPRGPLLIHAGISGDGIGLDNLTYLVHQVGAQLFGDRWNGLLDDAEGWGDPAGQSKDEIFEQVGFDFLRSRGLPAREAPTQDPRLRVECIQDLTQKVFDGRPGIIVNKRCTHLIAGLAGRWYYRTQQVSGETIHQQQPMKNEFSHECDALGYLILGAGGFRRLQGREAFARHRGQVYNDRVEVDPFGVLT